MLRAKFVVVTLMGLSCGLVFLGYDIRIGVRIRAYDIGQLAVCAIFLWYALNRGVRSDVGSFLLGLGTYALCVACGALLQTSTGTAVRESIQLMLFALFFLAFAQYVTTPEMTRRFVIVFLATLWVLAVWNAGYHILHGKIAGWKNMGDQKLTHSIIFLVMALLIFSPLRPQGKWWWWPLFALALVFMVLSGERKGWVAALPGIAAAMLISDKGGIDARALRRMLQLGLVFIGFGLLMVVLAHFVPYVEKQVTSIGDFTQLLFSSDRSTAGTTMSNRGRLFAIEFATQQFMAHPLFGIGPGNYVRVVDGMNIDHVFQKGAHNELLRIAAELGLAGLASYALIYVMMIARTVALALRMNRLDDHARLRLRLGIGLMIYGFIANIFLAGGGLNTYLVILPAALLYSTAVPRPEVRPLADRATGLERRRPPRTEFRFPSTRHPI